MTEVYLAEGNAYAATKHVLEMSNFSSMIKEKSKIVIKPNLAVSRRPNEGITTDVKVVRAILDKIPKKKKVVVLEGSTQATTSFKLNGYEDLKKDVPKIGTMTHTPRGEGKVLRQNLVRGTLTVLLESGEEMEISCNDVIKEKT